MSDNINTCAVCKVPARQLCAGCKNVYYCNREHQKKHWKEGHKNNCSCYKVVVSDRLGAHLVATRDLKQNEVILKDAPIVIGPSKSSLTCLGCNKSIRENPVENNLYRCKNCFWPLCGKKCQESPLHKAECLIMKDKFTLEDMSNLETNKKPSVIGPLRCLLLKATSKPKYDHLKSLPIPNTSKDHQEQIQTTIVPFIKSLSIPGLNENEIIDVTKTYDLFSLEINKDDNIHFRGLYPIAAMLKHKCKPNTKHSIHGDNHQFILMSTVPIPKGGVITISHAETLWGTLARREHLMETRSIVCECDRCVDNTELGTYLGAIFCCKCKKKDNIECPKILSSDPLNPQAVWKCEKCDHTIRGRQMIWGNEAIKDEIGRIDKRIPLNLEKFLVKYKETLHPKNYHVLVVKYALSQIYGNSEGYLYSDLTDEIIDRKVDICQELMEVLDILDPGFTKIRGALLYELQSTMVVQTKREFNKGHLTKATAQDQMMECLVLLKEATQILGSEPDTKEFLSEQLENFSKEFDFDE